MKGLKALRERSFEKYVKITVEKLTHSERHFAYTAETIETASGEVLIVNIYGGEYSNRSKLTLPIVERHFMTGSGEIAAERFSGDFKTSVGKFSVTNTKCDSWDSSSRLYNLAHEYDMGKYVPIEKADKVILSFAKLHKFCIKSDNYCGARRKNYSSGLSWLAAYQTEYKNQKSAEAEQRLRDRTNARMAQIGENIPIDFAVWVDDEKFSPAAWFYKYKNRSAEGVCGACKKKSTIAKVQNKKYGTCPSCGRPIQYISIKNADRVCRYRYNTAMVWQVSEDEFVSRFFQVEKEYANRDFSVESVIDIVEASREFWSVKNGEITTTGLYKALFNWMGGYCRFGRELLRWKRVSPRYGVGDPGVKYPGNILEITRTLAERLNSKTLCNMDLRPLFENDKDFCPTWIFKQVLDYPAIESMAKMGLYSLARSIIYYGKSTSTILKPSKTGSPAKLLGVDKLTLAKFAEIGITLPQYSNWRDCGLSLNDFEDFRTAIDNDYPLGEITDLVRGCDFVKFGTLVRYLEKQRKKFELSARDATLYWRDYLTMARQLNLDLQNRALLYPENIKREHDRIMILQKEFRNRELNEKLSVRVKILENLMFSNDDFVIAPLRSAKEFLNESSILNHCVKTYTERCANGETNIFGLRKVGEPDSPYFTVNINNHGGLIQNRGKNNCPPPKDVTKFVNKWLKFVEKKLKTVSLDPTVTAIKLQIGA